MASFAYDIAKQTARFAKHKGAHDSIVVSMRQLQANALEIVALAKCRLADEYDAAQERGEVGQRTGRPKVVPDGNDFIPPSADDVGLSRKVIQEARQIRDAEKSEPGIIHTTLNNLVAEGKEPTIAAFERGVVNRTSFTGNNQWFTPEVHLERARRVLGGFDLDPASHD